MLPPIVFFKKLLILIKHIDKLVRTMLSYNCTN